MNLTFAVTLVALAKAALIGLALMAGWVVLSGAKWRRGRG